MNTGQREAWVLKVGFTAAIPVGTPIEVAKWADTLLFGKITRYAIKDLKTGVEYGTAGAWLDKGNDFSIRKIELTKRCFVLKCATFSAGGEYGRVGTWFLLRDAPDSTGAFR